MRLRNKLSLIFILITIVVLALSTQLDRFFYARAFEKDIGDSLEDLNSVVSKLSRDYLDASAERLSLMMYSIDRSSLLAGLSATAESENQDSLSAFSETGFYDLLFVDRSGNVVTSLRNESDNGKNISENRELFGDLQDYYFTLKNPGDTFMTSTMNYKPSLGKESLFMAVRGNTGTIIAQLDLSKFEEELANLTRDNSYIIAVDGRMLVHSGEAYSEDFRMENLLTGSFTFGGEDYLSRVEQSTVEGRVVSVVTLNKLTALKEEMREATSYSFIFTMIFGLLGAAGVYVFSGKIASHLVQFKNVMNRAAGGDLTISFETKNKNDEIAEMSAALNTVTSNLKSSMQILQELSGAVSNSSIELAESSTDISHRTQEQAAAVEELNSSMEELNASFENIVSAVESIDKNMQDVRSRVEDGKLLMHKSYENLMEMRTLSEQIEDISEFVNEIAFQTNLLSLNAAVEASRAGDQGRGFAVIAAEIRELSQKTMQHSKSITEILKKSDAKMRETDGDIRETIAAYDEIVVNTVDVSVKLNSKMANLEQQKSAVTEITEVLTDINSTVQGNASIVEELAATAENLAAAAEELKGLLKRYRVENTNDTERKEPSRLTYSPMDTKMEKY